VSAEAIQAVAHVSAASIGGVGAAGLEAGAGTARATAGGDATFAEMVGGALEKVNAQLLASQTDLQQLAVGDVENLHHVMIRLEESRLSFQLVMQVRNRLLEAYQDVMRMQV
jgi:flagellar hook-basal body complex protein FliE